MVISDRRVNERAQALKVRNASNLAPFARSPEFLLDGIDCNVVEVTLSCSVQDTHL